MEKYRVTTNHEGDYRVERIITLHSTTIGKIFGFRDEDYIVVLHTYKSQDDAIKKFEEIIEDERKKELKWDTITSNQPKND